MSEQKTKHGLTTPQRLFLESYIEDIVGFDDAGLQTASREDFVRRVAKMDFDGGDTLANCQIARNLKEKGLLTELTIHRVVGQPYIYLVFSEAGADAIYNLVKQRQAAETGVEKFSFIYVDRTENRVTGEVEASNAAHAAVKIMGECGVGDKPRHARHAPAVKEERLMWAGNGELISFKRDNVFFLEIKKVGTRKRKPLEFSA